jgi:hypothetical protein
LLENSTIGEGNMSKKSKIVMKVMRRIVAYLQDLEAIADHCLYYDVEAQAINEGRVKPNSEKWRQWIAEVEFALDALESAGYISQCSEGEMRSAPADPEGADGSHILLLHSLRNVTAKEMKRILMEG